MTKKFGKKIWKKILGKNFEENLTKKFGKKIWKKILGKNFEKNFDIKIWKKKLEKKFDKKILIDIITRKIPRGVLETRVCLACETLETNPEKILRKILTKNFEKKI